MRAIKDRLKENPYFQRLRDSPDGYRLARGTFWSLLGTIFSRFSGLLASMVIARVLGKQGFGEFGIVQSTVIMTGALASFGTGITSTKYIAELRHSDPARTGRILGGAAVVAAAFGGIFALLLFLFAPWLAATQLSAPHLGGILRISAAYLFFSAMNGAQIGALAGFEAFRVISRVNVLSGILGLLVLPLAVYRFGLQGAVWGNNLVILITWGLAWRSIREVAADSAIRIDYRHCMQEIDVLWKFSLPSMLANALVGPVTWVCNAMLVNQPDGYREMGAYSAATQWRQILLFLPGLVAQVVLPIMASQAGRLPASRQIRANLLVNLALALPILIVLCLLSPFIMRAYGNDFRNGWLMFAIVQCAAFFQVLQSPVITWWAASGRMWINFFTNLCWSGTLVFLSWRFIEWGAQGLAVASLISFGVFGILMWIVVTKFMDLHAGAGR